MNAKVLANGLEKCKLLTKFLGQIVEKLDKSGCPKNQDPFGEVKAESSWICSSYPFRHKTWLHCLHCAERKAKVYGYWTMEHLYL